jgi:hypothetical protein
VIESYGVRARAIIAPPQTARPVDKIGIKKEQKTCKFLRNFNSIKKGVYKEKSIDLFMIHMQRHHHVTDDVTHNT